MTNLLRSYLGLDKEPEPESKPDPRLERTAKFARPVKKEKAEPKTKLASAHKHREEKENGNE